MQRLLLLSIALCSAGAARADEAWSCVPGVETPVRLRNGDVECASRNGRDCLWKACPGRDAPTSSWSDKLPLRPLACGADHRMKFGIDGYSAGDHWCHHACLRLGCSKVAAAPPASGPFTFTLQQGEGCPAGSVHVTYDEAVANRDQLCRTMGKWDIRRLADSGSMDGPGYGCGQKQKDPRGMGGAICKPAPAAPPPPPPPGDAGFVLQQGEACPPGTVYFTLADAANARRELCRALGEWDIRRLEGGAAMTGRGYHCELREREPGLLGGAICKAAPAAPPPPPPPSSGFLFALVEGEACPPGSSHVTLAEAANHKGELCRALGEWDVRRIANGGAMVGRGYKCQLRESEPSALGGAICKPGMAAPPPPPPPPPPPTRPVVPADRFTEMMAAVKNEAFSSDKERVMRELTRNRWFTVDQLIQLIDDEGFGFDVPLAVEVFAPHLVDKADNGFRLLGKVQFDSDKEKIQGLLNAP